MVIITAFVSAIFVAYNVGKNKSFDYQVDWHLPANQPPEQIEWTGQKPPFLMPSQASADQTITHDQALSSIEGPEPVMILFLNRQGAARLLKSVMIYGDSQVGPTLTLKRKDGSIDSISTDTMRPIFIFQVIK